MAKVISVALLSMGALVLLPAVAMAGGPPPGECNSGFCGTPKNNGGGCSCSCGGSILVNNTDIGTTYSTTDDSDGDSIADDFDNCPFIPNRDQIDSDGDGRGNACDNCMQVPNKDQSDINGNNIGDVCDPDIDGDGLLNAVDNCAKVPNIDQGDINMNAIGDACDPDMDGDGVLNRVDNCPRIYNPDQSKTIPGLNGNACDTDFDKDLVDDGRDNCPRAYNPDQHDINANNIGDACDVDMDGDAVLNTQDNCPTVANPDQKDADHNGVGDACDPTFCFVTQKARSAPCLDPASVFAVTATPEVVAKTGESIFPTLLSNRENVGIRYTWTVTQQPDGANDSVRNPLGTVSVSQQFEYRYNDEKTRPTFVPRMPGTYKLTVAGDLVTPDKQFPQNGHAENTVVLSITGSPQAGGCQVGTSSRSGFAMLGLLGVALLGLVRRRRSA